MTSKKIFLLLVVFITGCVLFSSGERDIWIHIFSIVAVAIASSIVVKFDVYHPSCIYVSFFALYSIGYAVIYYFDLVTRFGYSKEAMVCMWLAISLCTLLLPIQRKEMNITFKNKSYQGYAHLLYYLSTLLSVLTYISLVYIIRSGFSGKGDIYTNGGIIINTICKMVYFNMMYITMYLFKMLIDHDKFRIKWFLFNISSVAIFGIVTGERDYLFHILLIACLCFSLVNIIKKTQIPLLLMAGLLLVTLTKSFKYVFLTGEGDLDFYTTNIVLSSIDGEFSSAGRNMQVLVAEHYYNYFGGRSLLIDLFRVFYDFGFSTISWFNNVVLYDIHTGYGFTIVGEGYVNGGYWGIVLVISLTTLLIRYLYLKSSDSFYYLCVYIYMLPQFIYATRADIAGFISPLVKHVLLAIFILYILGKVFGKKKIKTSAF
jgi:oligosaccharide repeat unit polymerase